MIFTFSINDSHGNHVKNVRVPAHNEAEAWSIMAREYPYREYRLSAVEPRQALAR